MVYTVLVPKIDGSPEIRMADGVNLGSSQIDAGRTLFTNHPIISVAARELETTLVVEKKLW